MSLTQRHKAVHSLEAAAFEGATGREDINILKQGIYEAAQEVQVLEVIALDADLVIYDLQRAHVLDRPVVPEANATAATIKRFELLRHAYTQQSTALATLKAKILKALDEEATQAIQEPIHGILRLSVNDILQRLTTEYHQMTFQELKPLRERWTAMRWDQSTDFITFLAHFREQMAFLTLHNVGPSEGEQIIQLHEAISHVPVFAQLADSQFQIAVPVQSEQTFENMAATYRKVYRTQYANSTAAQHYTASQAAAKAPVPASASPVLEGIIASARTALHGATVSADTASYMAQEVAKTIQRCMQPPVARSDRVKKSGGQKPGMCDQHPNSPNIITHTWEECRLNPANKKGKFRT